MITDEWASVVRSPTHHFDLWRWVDRTQYVHKTTDDGIIGADFDALIKAWDRYSREMDIPDSEWYKKHPHGPMGRKIFAEMRKKNHLGRVQVLQTEVGHVGDDQEQEVEPEPQEPAPVQPSGTTGNDVEERREQAPQAQCRH